MKRGCKNYLIVPFKLANPSIKEKVLRHLKSQMEILPWTKWTWLRKPEMPVDLCHRESLAKLIIKNKKIRLLFRNFVLGASNYGCFSFRDTKERIKMKSWNIQRDNYTTQYIIMTCLKEILQ